jgi:PAS domain S-box-containing protein
MPEGLRALRILNLEDNPLDAQLIHATLADGGIECEVTRVQTRADFAAALGSGDVDLVLADYSLPSFDGLSALELVQEVRPGVPFVLVSGALGEERAIEALKSGATDYVLKQRLERLVPAVRRAVREADERAERKRAEEALRESEERFRATFEQAAVGIAHVNADGRWLRVNQKLCEIVGYSREELLGKTFQDITHPDDLDADLQQARRLLSGEIETYSMEKRYVKKDNSIVWTNLTGSLVREPSGKPKYLIAVIEDISERKWAEETIREVREAERQRIAYDLHDGALQDLTYALAEAQLVQETLEDPELNHRLERTIEALKRTGQELRAAVYDLSLGEEPERPLPELVKALVQLNSMMIPGCGVRLEVQEGFPSNALGKRGLELLRIVQEALTNTRKHSNAQNVLVSLGAEGREFWAEISDDGRGFGPGTVPGVGLRSMRERAHALGGTFNIESEPGKGTKVRLEMDLAGEGEEPRPEQETRILLVEDHASFREAAASVFEQEPGFEVVGQAGSLAEARELLEDGVVANADIAIVDLGLPDGYGGELIKELREINPQAQALVLSATLERPEVARAVEAGAAAVLHKSEGIEKVVEDVRRLRAGETLLSMQEVVELLRLACSHRDQEREEREALERLTPREKEVLQALAEGLDSKDIARRLSISPTTERNHVASILAKLEVHSRLQALVFAMRHGITRAP